MSIRLKAQVQMHCQYLKLTLSTNVLDICSLKSRIAAAAGGVDLDAVTCWNRRSGANESLDFQVEFDMPPGYIGAEELALLLRRAGCALVNSDELLGSNDQCFIYNISTGCHTSEVIAAPPPATEIKMPDVPAQVPSQQKVTH